MKERLLKIIPILMFVFVFGSVIGLCNDTAGIPLRLVRFHIVANDNDSESQRIKWQVRKEIFENLELQNINSKEEALLYFEAEKDNLKAVADRVLKENNVNYESSIYIGKKYFPVREYKSFTLPAGEYDTVSINLGNGKGENFFCVMYPSLCKINSITEKTDENPELLKSVLTEKEVEATMETGNKIVVKFKLAEIVGKILSK